MGAGTALAYRGCQPREQDNLFINELSYFNLFECGKNILGMIDATCERVCMATSMESYYTEMFKTLTDYNERNNTPFYNKNIQEEILKLV